MPAQLLFSSCRKKSSAWLQSLTTEESCSGKAHKQPRHSCTGHTASSCWSSSTCCISLPIQPSNASPHAVWFMSGNDVVLCSMPATDASFLNSYIRSCYTNIGLGMEAGACFSVIFQSLKQKIPINLEIRIYVSISLLSGRAPAWRLCASGFRQFHICPQHSVLCLECQTYR